MDNQKRITKAMRFADIKAMVNGGAVLYGTTTDEAVAFIDHEIELLSRKNASGEKKPTATQIQNEKYKAEIMDFLYSRDSREGMTCTAIGKSIPSLSEFGTSKYASLCNALVTEGKLTKATVKGSVLFYLA